MPIMRAILLFSAILLALLVDPAVSAACIHTVGDPTSTAASPFTRLADAPVFSTDAVCSQTNDKLFIFGGFGPLTPQNTLVPVNSGFSLDLNTNTWTPLADAPFNGTRSSSTNNGTHIFVVGGFEGNAPGTPRTGAHVYSVADNTWTSLPSLPAATGAGGLAIVGSTLIYISGQTGTGVYSASVLALDLSSPTGAWTAVPSAVVPSPRADFIALAINTTTQGTIIVNAGGNIGTEFAPIDLNTTFSFVPASNSFAPLAQMPSARSHYGGLVAQAAGPLNCCPERVLLLGGRSQQDAAILSTIVEYSPEEDTWTTIANLPHQWYSPCAAIHTNATGTFLFVTGGGLDFFFPINLTYVAPFNAACNVVTAPVVPPAPPATVPITAPPAVTGAAIGNSAAASTTTAAGSVAVATVGGAAAATTGSPSPALAAAAAAAATTATATASTGTAAPPTSAPTTPPTTAPTTSSTATTEPPTTAPTTTPTKPPTTAPPTTTPTTAPPTSAPTTPPTTAPPPPSTTTATLGTIRPTLNNAAILAALAAAAGDGATTGFRTIKPTFTGVTTRTFAGIGKPTFTASLSPLAPARDANSTSALSVALALLFACLGLLWLL